MSTQPLNNGILGGVFGPSPAGGGILDKLNDPRVAMGLAMMGGRGGFGDRAQAGLSALQGAQQGQMHRRMMELQIGGLEKRREEAERERQRREQQSAMLFGGTGAPTNEAGPFDAEGMSPPQDNRTAGILANMGYGPEDIAFFQAMGPEATMKLISERRFAKPTDDIAEYNMAVEQGFGGSLQDWIIHQKRAGASRTNISLPPAERAYDTTRGGFHAEMANSLDQSAMSAQSRLSDLDRMEAALTNPNVYTGTGGEAVTALKRAAGALGFDVEGVADAEIAQAVSNQLALSLRNTGSGAGMPGSMSNSDRQFLVDATPNLGKTPAGNALLLEYNRRVTRRQVEMARLAREYEAQHGRLDAGFYSVASQYSDNNPLFTEQDAAQARQIESVVPVRAPTAGTPLEGWSIEEVR